jgi:tetratricopeptide (TPR) repeat protein/tRNA A-37 threonylcarbamoyl transferase component Bud32
LTAPDHDSPRIPAVLGHSDAHRPDARTVGRYVVLERIGTGGMGAVYKAYDPGLDRRVAVKVLRADRARSTTSEIYRQRLWREAQTLARLSHPNVVRVFDVGTVDNRLFIAMEYLEGASLRRWLQETRRDFAALWPIFVAVAQGLAAAHEAGVVHRDFKPDNVVVCDDGRPVVLDFGIARAGPAELDVADPTGEVSIELGTEPGDGAPDGLLDNKPLTHPGRAMGTPAYMSPEQHLGAPLDGRSDQYAWCVALWEALAGIRPFIDRPSVMLERKLELARQFDAMADGLPRWITPMLRRGLSLHANDRFPTMLAIVDAIERARPRPRRWVRPMIVTGFAAAVVGVSLGASVGERSRCESVVEEVSTLWNDARREAIRARFAASGVAYAVGSWTLVRRRIDDYVERWQRRWTPACEAATAGGRAAEGELVCLERGLRRLAARIEVIQDATPEVIENATRVVADLGPPERCAGDVGFDADDPDDSAQRERIEALRVAMAGVEALELAGRYDEGFERGQRALADAQRIGHAPSLAEALLLVGRLHKARGEFERAESTLTESAWTATAARHDEIAARAMIELVVVVGRELGNLDGGMTWAQSAEVAIGRAGGDELLEAGLLNNIGLVQFREGRFEEARSGDALALEIRARVLGPEHPIVATSHNNLGSDLWMLGRLAQAEVELRRAIEIHEATSGPDHPRLAASLDNLGALIAERGDPEQARPLVQRALEIRERALGPFHPSLADTLINLGTLHVAVGDLDTATALFERAVGVIEGGVGRQHPTMATCLSNLGGVQLSRKQFAAARTSFATAVDIYGAALGPDSIKVGLALANLGEVDRQTEAYAEAERSLQRATEILARGLGDSHPKLGYAQGRLGLVRLALGRPREAIADLEHALAIGGEIAANLDARDELRFALARAVWLADRDRSRALELATASRTGADPSARREIDRFIADVEAAAARGGPLRGGTSDASGGDL